MSEIVDGPPPLETVPDALIPTSPSASITSGALGIDLHPLLGLSPASSRLRTHLLHLSQLQVVPEPTIKSFSDSVYFSYYPLGLSLVFQPTSKSYKLKGGLTRAELDDSQLKLVSIDIYNHEAHHEAPKSKTPLQSTSTKPTFSAFPCYPILALHAAAAPPYEPQQFSITPESVGKDFTTTLGEADRKGGGEGSMGIWTEWTSLGILVEFAAAGLEAWNQGGESKWRIITVFERGVLVGQEDTEGTSM